MKAGISKPTRNRNQFFRFVLSTPQVENWKGAESLIDLRAQGIFSVTGNKTVGHLLSVFTTKAIKQFLRKDVNTLIAYVR